VCAGSSTPSVSKSAGGTRLATVISVLALIVSGLSAYYSLASHKDVSGIETIRKEYEFYYEFERLEIENWQLSHIFALPEWYDENIKLVSSSLTTLDAGKRAELLLKERAIARFIFTNFEEIMYESRHARQVGDSERAAFLEEVLDYFTDRLLRNPRLLYQWSPDGGKLAADFESDTRKYYDERVLHNSKLPLTQKPDPLGPYPAETKKTNSSRLKKMNR